MDIQPCMKTRYIYKNNSNDDTIDVNSVYDSISKNIPYEIGSSSDNIINNDSDNTNDGPHQVEEEEMSPPSIIPDLQPMSDEEEDNHHQDDDDDDDDPDDEDYHTHYDDDDLDSDDDTDQGHHHQSPQTPIPKSVNNRVYNHKHTPLPTNIPTPTHMIQGHNGFSNDLHHPYSKSNTNKPSKSPNYGRLTKNTKHQGMYKYDPLELKHPNRRKKQNQNQNQRQN